MRPNSLTTAQAFLVWHANEPLRHKFVRGDVFAFADAEERHVMATGNIYVVLRAHLRDTSRRTFITDMTLRVAADCYFYPDVMVTCSIAAPKSRNRRRSSGTRVTRAHLVDLVEVAKYALSKRAIAQTHTGARCTLLTRSA